MGGRTLRYYASKNSISLTKFYGFAGLQPSLELAGVTQLPKIDGGHLTNVSQKVAHGHRKACSLPLPKVILRKNERFTSNWRRYLLLSRSSP